MTAPGSAHAQRTQRHFVILTVLRWFPTGLIVPVMVMILRERGLDLGTIGLLGVIYAVATIALELPTGGLSDVMGRRPVLVTSALIAGVSSMALAFGTTIGTLTIGYLALGVSRALDSGTLQAWFVDQVRQDDASAPIRSWLARAGVAESLGLGVGALSCGGLVAWSPFASNGNGGLIAMSTPFIVSAALSLVHTLIIARWIHARPRGSRPTVGDIMCDVRHTISTGLRLAAQRGTLRRIAMLTLGAGVALSSIELLAPEQFSQIVGDDAASIYSVLVTAGFVGSATGSALAPIAVRICRTVPRAMLVSVLGAAVTLAFVSLPAFWAAAVAFVGFYVMLGISGPLLNEITHDAVTSRERATILSVNSMALQSGGIIAKLTVGFLAAATSVAAGLIAGAIALGLFSVVLFAWPKEEVATTPRASA